MSVFVTGATGVLGRRLVERLAARGHSVVGLARDDAGAELIEARGGVPRRGDVLDRDSLERAIDAPDAVVHAATAIPTESKPSEAAWERNDRVRLEGAKNIVSVAGDDADQILFPSVVWVARQPDGSAFDETATRHPTRATRSAAETEDYLRDAGAERGFDAAILRCGFFYAPDAAHTRQFGEQLLAGRLPVVGGGALGRRDAELSWLHADDAARAFAAAVDAEASGLFHVVDDRPATAAEFLGELADRVDASAPRRIPAWLARAFVGAENATLLSQPMPTTAEQFRSATGWEPVHPTYREGLRQVVEAWKRDGTIREAADGYEWVGRDDGSGASGRRTTADAAADAR